MYKSPLKVDFHSLEIAVGTGIKDITREHIVHKDCGIGHTKIVASFVG